ncbi:MAG: hypothetical protein WC248_05435 [Candidatus Methanomethylophilaceae archaeon]
MKVYDACINGDSCTCRSLKDAITMATSDEEMEVGDEFTIKCKEMTQEEYDSLEEFQGW